MGPRRCRGSAVAAQPREPRPAGGAAVASRSLTVASVATSSASWSASTTWSSCATPSSASGRAAARRWSTEEFRPITIDALGAQRERRLQRRVQAHAAVAVPAGRGARPADLDRRERARDRRRREHVLGR